MLFCASESVMVLPVSASAATLFSKRYLSALSTVSYQYTSVKAVFAGVHAAVSVTLSVIASGAFSQPANT